jgi:hypothetical protein
MLAVAEISRIETPLRSIRVAAREGAAVVLSFIHGRTIGDRPLHIWNLS